MQRLRKTKYTHETLTRYCTPFTLSLTFFFHWIKFMFSARSPQEVTHHRWYTRLFLLTSDKNHPSIWNTGKVKKMRNQESIRQKHVRPAKFHAWQLKFSGIFLISPCFHALPFWFQCQVSIVYTVHISNANITTPNSNIHSMTASNKYNFHSLWLRLKGTVNSLHTC